MPIISTTVWEDPFWCVLGKPVSSRDWQTLRDLSNKCHVPDPSQKADGPSSVLSALAMWPVRSPLWEHGTWTSAVGSCESQLPSCWNHQPHPIPLLRAQRTAGRLPGAATACAEGLLSTMQPSDTLSPELPATIIYPFPNKSCLSICQLHTLVLRAPILVVY